MSAILINFIIYTVMQESKYCIIYNRWCAPPKFCYNDIVIVCDVWRYVFVCAKAFIIWHALNFQLLLLLPRMCAGKSNVVIINNTWTKAKTAEISLSWQQYIFVLFIKLHEFCIYPTSCFFLCYKKSEMRKWFFVWWFEMQNCVKMYTKMSVAAAGGEYNSPWLQFSGVRGAKNCKSSRAWRCISRERKMTWTARAYIVYGVRAEGESCSMDIYVKRMKNDCHEGGACGRAFCVLRLGKGPSDSVYWSIRRKNDDSRTKIFEKWAIFSITNKSSERHKFQILK